MDIKYQLNIYLEKVNQIDYKILFIKIVQKNETRYNAKLRQ